MGNETNKASQLFDQLDALPTWSHPEGGTVICKTAALLSACAFVQKMEGVGQPQPSLSAAVERLEGLVVRWRATRATAGGFYPEAAAYADGQDSAREACADELADALQHLQGPRAFDPKRDQEELCRCGHPYYRHFDWADDCAPVGCKYCDCRTFEGPREETRT